jgi:arginase
MTRQVAVIGAPSAIGLVPDENGEPRRLDLAPDALRAQQLVPRLRAQERGDVEPPSGYRDLERPSGRVRNEEDLAAYSGALEGRVRHALAERQFVLLLGGDCSILLGALLGMRAVDEVAPGVVYIDAHADFATLAESPSGSACSMALALAVGREERPLARLAAGAALTSGERVAHIGRREGGEPPYGADALESYGVLDLPKPAIDSKGAPRIAQEALDHMAGTSGGFWIHFDVDVLDPPVFPATGDLAPGGIDLDEAVELLGPLVQHPSALGMQLTLYDPTLDQDGHEAQKLVDLLERAFA